MHRRRNTANRWWWVAVFVVGVAAIIVVKTFRPPRQEDPKDERAKEVEKAEAIDVSLISTQVLSFSLDGKAELDSVADESGSIYLKNRPERPGAPIVHSDPSPAQLEALRKEGAVASPEGSTELNKPGVKIVVE
jgi:hypothetical protein